MAITDKLANGWQVTKASLRVLNAHKELVIFPIMSGIVLSGLIAGAYYILSSDVDDRWRVPVVFACYFIGYFVTAFLNTGLLHCTRSYLQDEKVSIAAGLRFAAGRVGAIASWVLFAATVGMILRLIQDRGGMISRVAGGIASATWGVTTFFALPVIAYENVTPMEAVKRSAAIVAQKWGAGIGANFSIGLVAFLCFLPFAVLAMGISASVNEQAGIWMFAAILPVLLILSSSLHTILIGILYMSVSSDAGDAPQKMPGDLFVER